MQRLRRPHGPDGDCDRHEGPGTQQRRCVLVVEDDDHIRDLIAVLLRSEDYDVVELGDGMEALNYLAASEVYGNDVRRPDLVVADILMPTFSGLDLMAGMRESDLGPPVMVVTGVRDEEIHREARRLGATRILSKPFEVPQFLVAVEDSMASDTPSNVVDDGEVEIAVPDID